MEKKNNSGVLVGLLIGIIIMLVIGIALFATGTIGFKTNTTGDNGQISENDQTDDNKETKEMTKEEATNILKTAANKIGKVSNGYPYCGDNMVYDEGDVILGEQNISTHTASKDYKSLNELKGDLKNYMSDELINKYIVDSEYLDKDQKLYCKTYHRGAVLYDNGKSSYTIEAFTSNEIIAKGVVVTFGEGYEYKNNVNIEMKKTGNNWQITKYEIQK